MSDTTTHAPSPAEASAAPRLSEELDAIEGFGPQRFANRELSRLDFGARLLDLAEDASLPLLERVKFMAIFSELLDEFFQVRVAGLEDQVVGGVTTRSADGLRPREQLVAIRQRTTELVRRQDRIFLEHLQVELAAAGIRIESYGSLGEADRAALQAFFVAAIYPILTPLAVDPGHPFPMISNLSLNLAVQVRDPATGEERIARVKVPPVLPRFLPIGEDGRFVPVDQVIAAHLDTLFPGMVLGEPETFRVTRNADLTLEEEEAEDLLIALEMELRRRRFGRAVRLEAHHKLSSGLRELLLRELDLTEDAAYTVDAPIGLAGLWSIYAVDRADLHAETWTPITPPRLLVGDNESADIFSVLRERDVLLHHPYDSFSDSVEAFVAQAADDPDVLGIKHTLYRTSGDSPIVASLIRAAESGKQVAALVELKARFDEAANIGWAKALEDTGVHVVYGIMGYKTHSKTALVLRREADGVRRYCHIGTGNYNSKTARMYEDVGLLTADEEITSDVAKLFNFLTGFSRHASYERLLVSPVSMRPRIIELINEEREAGPEGAIDIKVNGLTDPQVIDELYAASRAGVPIRLVVRGLCCLRPGIPELSENIAVCSIVGEFLEHSRIFSFGRPGGPSGHRVLIGSSDLMERNLDRRIEATTPVTDPILVEQLDDVLERNFADDRFSWVLGPDQRWRRRESVAGRSVQEELKQLAIEQHRRWREQEA
ncbi:MAG TPA: polyphosphate kinase 1 [Acidimicrobiales bacterium]|jgi:polyphosphate kinase|nr:polyphosphate kinase 1 [Acidimicrobiales bacterium]